MRLYLICAAVAFFCILALGLGPALFVLVGAAIAVSGFRRRRAAWWGLPMAAGGAGLVVGDFAAWGWHAVVLAVAVPFAVVTAMRVAGHTMAAAPRSR